MPWSALRSGDVVLPKEAAHYVTRVHRLRAGDRFLAFDPEARVEADVEIVDAGRAVRGRVGPVLPSTAPPGDSVVLLQAIGKGDKPERVVAAATALAVEQIVFVETERSIARVGDRAESRLVRYGAVAVEAARQCGRGDVPAVVGPVSLPAALGELPSHDAQRLCLDASGARLLGEALGDRRGRGLVLVIGPEGGLSPAELELCRSSGFELVRLGRYVLRTELAAMAALGAVAAESKW